jgi:flagellar basal-body rod protein FlgF
MYSTLSGAMAASRNLRIISNNLANINNSGFKRQETHFEALFRNRMQTTLGKGINFSRISHTSTDFSPGGLKRTEGTLDVAITGDGFFKVAGEDGFAYTRKGNFQLQEDGSLVTPSGKQVVGEQGPIILPSSQVSIDQDGTIRGENGPVGQLSVYEVPDRSALERQGSNLWKYTGAEEDRIATGQKVRQGYLEESNVESMQAMTDLIRTKRLFQAYQKNLQAYGDMAKQANEIGRIG